MKRRRRRKNPIDNSNIVTFAVVGFGLFVAYQIYQNVSNKVGIFANNLSGPATGQTWLNYLFGSGGTVDANGNFIAAPTAQNTLAPGQSTDFND